MDRAEKALYKTAFMATLAKMFNAPHILEAIEKTRSMRHEMIDNPKSNLSMIGYLMNTAKEHHAIGADKMIGAVNTVRKKVSDIDTGLGALAMGKPDRTSGWAKFRQDFFTDADKANERIIKNQKPDVLGGAGDQTEKVIHPSVSAPLKGFAKGILVPYLAYSKGMELIAPPDEYSHKGG